MKEISAALWEGVKDALAWGAALILALLTLSIVVGLLVLVSGIAGMTWGQGFIDGVTSGYEVFGGIGAFVAFFILIKALWNIIDGSSKKYTRA